MYLRVSKYLDEPVNVRRLIDASTFLSVFTLYVVLVWGVLLHLSMFSGFKSNQHESKQMFFACLINASTIK